MKGRIHSFQSLGTVDGPGVRCVVFMQGCPLRCICCHNPDTWDFSAGQEVDTDYLVGKILRLRSYFGERGGVTVSGGEPLMQAEFVTELFTKLKCAGINTALDTSGCVFNPDVVKLLGVTDLVLLDHKYSSDADYLANVGCSMKTAEDFLAELNKRGIPTWLRRVIIPGKTDTAQSTLYLKEVAKRYKCVEKTELLPFRNFCAEKYEALGVPFPLAETPSPSPDTMAYLTSLLDK